MLIAVLVGTLAACLLFFHEKYVFDRARGTLTRRRLPWKKQTWRLEDIEQVELWRAWLHYSTCKIAFKDGARLTVLASRTDELYVLRIAQTVATFLRVPLDDRDLTLSASPR